LEGNASTGLFRTRYTRVLEHNFETLAQAGRRANKAEESLPSAGTESSPSQLDRNEEPQRRFVYSRLA